MDRFINKIICGDSASLMKQIPSESVDIIFTSPPYNFGMCYDVHQDKQDWNSYFIQLWRAFDECVRILKHGGRFVINVQPLFSDYIPTHHIISSYLLSKGMLWKGEILWEKNNRNCAYTTWGSWKSPSSPYLKYTWEFVEIFCKGTLKRAANRELADITGNEFKTWVDARWSIAPERDMVKFGHPAMFPVELAYRVLKLFSFKNDVVLDPFNGVGTTTFAALHTDRRFIGIDLSQQYCNIAIDRLQLPMKNYSDILDKKLLEKERNKPATSIV